MQLELVLPLRDHRHHAGVVRARADLAETRPASPLTNSSTPKMPWPPRSSVTACAIVAAPCASAAGGHRMRLPALDIVAVDLHVADRLAEMRLDRAAGAERAHRQQRDLVVEVDQAFDDDAAVRYTPARARIVPGRLRSIGGYRPGSVPYPTTTSPA